MLEVNQIKEIISNYVKNNIIPDQTVCPELNITWTYQSNNVRYPRYFNVLTGKIKDGAPATSWQTHTYQISCNAYDRAGKYAKYIKENYNGEEVEFLEFSSIDIDCKKPFAEGARNWKFTRGSYRYFVFKNDPRVFTHMGDEVDKGYLCNTVHEVLYSSTLSSLKLFEEVQKLDGKVICSRNGRQYTYSSQVEYDYSSNNCYEFIEKWALYRGVPMKQKEKSKNKLTIEDVIGNELKSIEDIQIKPVISGSGIQNTYDNKTSRYVDKYCVRAYQRMSYLDHTTINDIDYDVIRVFMLQNKCDERYRWYLTYDNEEEALSVDNKNIYEYYRVYVSDKEVKCCTKQGHTWGWRPENTNLPWYFESNVSYIPTDVYPINVNEYANCKTRLKYFKSVVNKIHETYNKRKTFNSEYNNKNEILNYENFNVIPLILGMLRHPVIELIFKSNLDNIGDLLIQDNHIEANIRDYLWYNQKSSKELGKKFGLNIKQLRKFNELIALNKNEYGRRYNSNHYRNSYIIPFLKAAYNTQDLSSWTLEDFEKKLKIITEIQDKSRGYYYRDIIDKFEELQKRTTSMFNEYYVFTQNNDDDNREDKLRWIERLYKFNDPQAYEMARDTKNTMSYLRHDYKLNITKDTIKTIEDLSRLHDLAIRNQEQQQDEINELRELFEYGYGYVSANDIPKFRAMKTNIMALGQTAVTELITANRLNKELDYHNRIGAGTIELVYHNFKTAEDIHSFLQEATRRAGDQAELLAARAKAEAERKALERMKIEERRAKVDKERVKWQYENDEYTIRLPRTGDEIEAEGKSLHHCVGGYVRNHSMGDTTIMFLRKKSEDDKSLYTIEVNAGRVVQIHGLQNRWLQNNPELTPTVIEWLKATKLYCEPHILLGNAGGYACGPNQETDDKAIIEMVNNLYK